jgi:hypothetical protein
MSEKCPSCGRAVRKKARPVSDYERAVLKANANVNRNLRKPMPAKTVYK